MGPVAHVAMPLPVARLLRLNLAVTGFCALLPDVVDKPLWILGIGDGRYVAHTLLFLFLVAIAFSLKKKAWGLSALFGGMFHLLLDWSVPWFYPFVSYDFPPMREFSLFNFLHSYLSLSGLGKELIWIALMGLAILVYLWLSSRFRKLDKPEHTMPANPMRMEDEEQ